MERRRIKRVEKKLSAHPRLRVRLHFLGRRMWIVRIQCKYVCIYGVFVLSGLHIDLAYPVSTGKFIRPNDKKFQTLFLFLHVLFLIKS